MKAINKVYELIKKFIKENIFSIIFLILFAVFCFYDTGYSIYKPGGIINASNRIKGDNLYQSKGSFNMAYVGFMKGNLPFYLVAKLIPSWDLIKNDNLTYSNESIEEANIRDHINYNEAISKAKYVAFNASKVTYKVDSIDYYITYKTTLNDSDISIGDKILEYDNIKFNGLETFKEYIKTKNVNDTINIKYEHNNQIKETKSTIYEENNELYVGLLMSSIYNISSDYNLDIKTKDSESGPSGGLITALSIYNALTKDDLTKGKKIVGTGTIDYDGTVGEIGSVTYKLAAAVKEKADLFICPKENYEEAIDFAKKNNYKIKIKYVETFNEAVEYLKEEF